MGGRKRKFADDGWGLWIDGDDRSTIYLNEWLNPKGKSYVDISVRIYGAKNSKTVNLYTIYKFYNFIITKVENISMVLNPSKLKCKLQNLENMSESDVVSNAIYFCDIAANELKENAIIL